MKNKIKIFIIIPNLNRGGSEKFTLLLTNNIDKNKFDVTLVLLEKKGTYLDLLDSDIKIIELQKNKVSKAFFSLLKLIKKEQPDIVFSTLGHLNILLAFIKLFVSKNIVFIGRESTIPSLNNNEKFIFNFLYKLFYPLLDKIVCQSDYMLKDLILNYKINNDKLVKINNPIDFDLINKYLNSEKITEKDYLIAVGSLEKVKNYENMIDIFEKIEDKNIKLYIIGEGSLKEKIQSKIKNKKLEDRIKLLGFKKNPYIYMKNAKLFIMTSKFEGFPNSVVESIACGTPVIAFNAPGGLKEIIINDENGYLVPNFDNTIFIKTLNKYLKYSFNSEDVKKTVDKFNKNKIIGLYEDLFEKLVIGEKND